MSSEPEAGFRARLRAVLPYLEERRLDAVLLVDLEGLRNPSIRYLCGNPRDALLILTATGRSVLVPWDVPLAEQTATADRIAPFIDYGRSLIEAARALFAEEGCARVEVSGMLPFPQVRALERELTGCTLVCRQDGIDGHVLRQRQRKDGREIARLRRACAVSDAICAELPGLFASGPLPEYELAFFIEKRARELGTGGLGFDTLAAAPERSHAIHACPSVSSASFGAPGLSLLDFGIQVEGYTSDVTLTLIRGPLSRLQEEMVSAVEAAYALARGLLRPGVSPAALAREVDELFAARGFRMPHSLGHGIGLEPHEPPLLRAAGSDPEVRFQEDMVVALEPGLYDPRAGGVRWENDFLLVPGGAEALTATRILRLG